MIRFNLANLKYIDLKMMHSTHSKIKKTLRFLFLLYGVGIMISCKNKIEKTNGETASVLKDSLLEYSPYQHNDGAMEISRAGYKDKLYGFWLGQCIANWTGLITEMDKIGIPNSEGKGAGFYTREDWGKPDQPNLWGSNNYSETIDFLAADVDSIWGADDDTDIEYIYQELLYKNKTSMLTGEMIREGWLKHIKPEEENFLWVSNQAAYDLMEEGMVPPATGEPDNNPHYEMIDAQLTTEIFGFFAPGRPDVALKMAHLPIQNVARENAEWISEFNVVLYSLAPLANPEKSIKDNLDEMLVEARKQLPNDSYSAKMYDFVTSKYTSGATWEEARDALHEKYQIRQEDGYLWATKDTVCNGCFAAGINFGAGIVSLLYGEGDIKETIKIGTLCGWDSDNPTATWGGLLGFMLGKEGVEEAFGRKFADKFNIHRTRIGFPNNGIDDFDHMAQKGIFIIDRVVQEELGGGVDLEKDVWYIPKIK
ncbi:MAG: ADP-ribosylglycohydrolase family protein [Maribacter sp.]